MEINECVQNFRVTAIHPIEELEAQLVEMQHDKTGARLVWLNRASVNKTFGIAFRTPSEDDTGVFHILEHSVLGGSEKYPVKDPFLEMKKNSMQTFLNAMTFPDKTFYPIASRNDKDFVNLMRVYLDAVFFPSIYEKPEIFYQEGWHYEMRPGKEVAYNGVVFNEMKGALASPATLMEEAVNQLMFPDTCYRYEYGGDPAHIPELSYEQFLETHRRFYHPANSYIFLDGSLDLDAILKIIDGEYLSRFDFREMHTEIAYQKPVTGESTAYYALSPSEPLENRTRAAWAYGMGDYTCRKEIMAMRVLSDLLFGSNHAPLKQKILSAGLAEDASMQVMSEQIQNMVVITADNVADGKVDQLRELIEASVRQMIQEGLDHDHIKAALANMELKSRERSFGRAPQGLGFGFEVLRSWLYGGDPAANLSVGPLFEELNRLVDTGWYEQLLEKVLLQNDHHGQVTLLPSHTADEQRQQEERSRLAAAQAAWSAEERETLQARQEKLDAWQASQDSAENLAKLPRLALSDISEKPEEIPTAVEEIGGVKVLRHTIPAGGISYWNLYFDISDLGESALTDAAFLCECMGKLATEEYSALALQKQTAACIGALRFSIKGYSPSNTPDTCRYFLCASFNAMEHKLPQAVALVTEILNHTSFSSSAALQELVLQCKLRLEQTVIAAGNSIAMTRVLAGFSAEGVVEECTTGFTYLQSLRRMEKEAASLGQRLQALRGKIFDAGRLTISVTGAQEGLPIPQMAAGLPNTGKAAPACAVKAWGVRREGIVIPADVAFASQGGLLPISGGMQVAAQIISLAYLWNAVRVQGGAYGVGMRTKPQGCGVYYSYRDPKGVRSLDCYRQAADELRQIAASGADLTGFIIGTISGTEPVLSFGAQGQEADGWYFRNISYADRCASRREMLAVTPEALIALADDIARIPAQGGTCVVGSRSQVEACNLDTVYTL